MSKEFKAWKEVMAMLDDKERRLLAYKYAEIQESPALLLQFAATYEMTVEEAYAAIKVKLASLGGELPKKEDKSLFPGI